MVLNVVLRRIKIAKKQDLFFLKKETIIEKNSKGEN